MDEQKVLEMLQALKLGSMTIESAQTELVELLKSQHLKAGASAVQLKGVATVDLARQERQGVAEVVFGEGKSAAQIIEITSVLRDAGQSILVTRVEPEKAMEVLEREPRLQYDHAGRVLFEKLLTRSPRFSGPVGIVAAGTSDLGIVREAQVTLELNGEVVKTFIDVGVAGLHRLLNALPEIQEMSALICVAGMEGALASVLGGLVRMPLICVPTSVGYGAAMGGLSALSGMLTSCASGASVVNIDNGFGAAMAVLRIGDLVEQELKNTR